MPLNITHMLMIANFISQTLASQIHISYCLIDIFTWLTICYLKVNLIDLPPLFFPQPLLFHQWQHYPHTSLGQNFYFSLSFISHSQS